MTTRYTVVDGSRVGYSMIGAGPPLVFLPAASSHLDLLTQHEPMRLFIEALAEFAQVISYDHRGFGVSDPYDGDDDDWDRAAVEDLVAVMDAANVRCADLLAWDMGGPVALRAADLHPDRVRRLVLVNTCARYLRAPDYPAGRPDAWLEPALAHIHEHWGTGNVFAIMEPWVDAHPDLREWWGRWERSAGSPTRQRASFRRHITLDAREVVATLTHPALVLHASANPWMRVDLGRWLDEHLPDARFHEYEGTGHLFFYQHRDLVVGHVEEFLTGSARSTAERALATVLFTDIVSSTDRVAADGDASWRSVLDEHDELAASAVSARGGRLVKTTGDGILAVFASPREAIACAVELRQGATAIGLEIRAGIHVGEVELRGDDVAGLSVHVAARVQGLAGSNEILVTRTLADVVAGSAVRLSERGTHELKGVPRAWELFALDG